jgi:hypothetical protein
MGFFSKIFKGVKKVFKKIGRGIKKIAGKIGKFMNKIGIVGQIAMSFILPGLGEILGAMTSTMMGSANALVSGMGNFLNGAINIATKAGGIVKDIGSGIVKVIGKTIGATINAIPGGSKFTGFLKDLTAGKLDMTADAFLGKDGTLLGDGGLLGTVKSEALNIKAGVGDLFSMDTLKGKNIYADKYEKDLVNEAFDSSDLGDIGSEGGRSMTELDPQEMLKPVTENIAAPDAVTAVADGVTAPVINAADIPKGSNVSYAEDYNARMGNEGQPLSADDMVEEYGNVDATNPNNVLNTVTDGAGFGPGATPENIAKKNSILAKQSYGDRFLKTDTGERFASAVQTKFDEVKGKLTASNIASGIYKTFGQPPEVEESYAGTYGSSYKAPVVEQYEVAGASTIQNFAEPLQVSGYNNIYNPLAAPQSSWARTFGQLTT